MSTTENFSEIKEKPIISKPDKTLVITSVFLVTIGILAVFSSSAPRAIAGGENPLAFVLKQLVWLIIGVVGCWFFTYKINLKKLKPLGLPLAWVVVLLLALVEFTPLGLTVNNSTRWLAIGPIQFQPSEFAKPIFVLCCATMFSKNAILFDHKKLKYYIPFGLVLLFVLSQPNLSMVALLGITFGAIYLCAGGNFKDLLISFFCCCFAAIASGKIKPYHIKRLLIFLNPEQDPRGAGYNSIQSLIAFASGNFFGVGYGNSKQKLGWLPENHTDYIYAVIAEEFGFLGCLFIICLFGTFLVRGFSIASKTTDPYLKLLAFGTTFSICFQAMMNIGVTSSIMPPTGIPLPLISYGGSSLFVTLCMLGVLLNISRRKVDRISDRKNMYDRI